MIDLKKTLEEAKIRQTFIADYFSTLSGRKVHKQQINKMVKTNKLSKGWELAFKEYFNRLNIKIYYK